MKHLFLLLSLPLASCITINQGNDAAPRAARLMAAEAAPGPAMAYGAEAVLASYKPEKARQQTTEAAQALGGEILRDGTEQVVVRIPSQELTNYIEGLKKFGKLESFRIEGENISQPIEDNSLRLETLEQARSRYQALLTQADKMQDVLTINRELEQIENQLRYLRASQKENEERLEKSQVSVTIKKRSSFGPLGWILYYIWLGVKWLFWWG